MFDRDLCFKCKILETFQVECRKTKTKVATVARHIWTQTI